MSTTAKKSGSSSDKFHIYTKHTIKSLFGEKTKVVITSDALNQLTSFVRSLIHFLTKSTHEFMIDPQFHKKPKMTMNEQDVQFAIVDTFPRGQLVKELLGSKPAEDLLFRKATMNRFVDAVLQELRPDQVTKDGKYKKMSKSKHVISLFRHIAETIIAYICLQLRDDLLQMKTPRLKIQHLIKVFDENKQLSKLQHTMNFNFVLKK